MAHDMVKKLPVWTLAAETFQLTAKHFGTLLRYAWPWLLIMVASSAAINLAYFPLDEKTFEENSGALFAVILEPYLWIAVGALIAVPWHRYMLLNEEPRTSDTLKRASIGLHYFAIALFFTLAPVVSSMMAAIAVSALDMVPLFQQGMDWSTLQRLTARHWLQISIVFAVFLLTLVALARLSLRLPAIAIERSFVKFKGSWIATRGNALRMTAGTVIAILPSLLLIYAVSWLAGEPPQLSRLGFTISQIITDLINMTVGMTYVTFLSLAYRHFFGASAGTTTADNA